TYGLSAEELIREGTEPALRERKKVYLRERLEILARYRVAGISELEARIQRGVGPDSPAWADLIELKNWEAEVKEIERDLSAVPAA
ncbi:MAG: hypothetical protein C4293_07950, partial [Nitrospiraceae bacterium]